jgi:DNA-directed RNA polymerase subunit RPC12/RpoP
MTAAFYWQAAALTDTLAAARPPRDSPMIRYRCPKCKKALTANGADAGAKLACPDCGQRLQVPTPANKTILGEIQEDSEVSGTEPRQGAFASPPPIRRAATVDMPMAIPVDPPGVQGKPGGDSGIGRLMPCPACGNPIGREAAACLKCGEPNNWTHPRILRFLARKDRFIYIPNLEAQGRGYGLVGRSTRNRNFTDNLADVVGSLGFFGRATPKGLISVIGLSLGAKYLSQSLQSMAGKNGEAFAMDFRTTPPGWKSTNDLYWSEVMEFFGLTPPEPPHTPERPECNEIDYPPERQDFLKSPAAFFLIFGGVVFVLAVGFLLLVSFVMFSR